MSKAKNLLLLDKKFSFFKVQQSFGSQIVRKSATTIYLMVKTTDLIWCRANIVRCFFAHLVEWFLLVKQRWAKPRWWKIGRKWPKNPAKGVKNLDGKPLQGLNPTCSLLQSQSKHTSCKKERKGLKVYIIVFLFAKAEIQIVSILWIQSTSQLCWFATVGKHFLKNRPYVLCK